MDTEDTRNSVFTVSSAKTGTSTDGTRFTDAAFTCSNPNSELHEVAQAATDECFDGGRTLFAGYTFGPGGAKTFHVISAEGTHK